MLFAAATNATVRLGLTTSGTVNDGESTTINLITSGETPSYNFTISGAGASTAPVTSGTTTGTYNSSDRSYTFTFDLGNGNSVKQSFTLSGQPNAYTINQFSTTLNVTKQSSGGGGGGGGSGGSGDDADAIPDDVVKIHFGSGNDESEDYYYIDKQDATLEGLGLSGVTIETQQKAQEALETVNEAIVKKDNIRAYFGAMQNRLENTHSNLSTQTEHLQAAESQISDVDVAQEMKTFVRNQILTQSAVAMLAQANSLPQMALRLIG
ncbi:MAG: hypothetical protein IJU37_07755 [Desulfovibrio sp.]|nr:hypothetical protein [Desulfovibrio sp.]